MAFLIDIFAGLLVAFSYDLFRALRNKSRKITALLDILFWLITGLIILTALFYNSDIQLRAYEFFGILTGVFFYFSVLSSLLQPIHKLIANFFQFFSGILFTIGKFFVIIIKNGFLFLWMPFRFLSRWSRRLTKKASTAFLKQQKLIKRI